jgi:hypothetical protein
LVVSALAWMTGCSLPSAFACELDAQCVQADTAGVPADGVLHLPVSDTARMPVTGSVTTACPRAR